MFLFEASIPNSLRDTRGDLKNEVMASVDDYMEERQKGWEDTPDEATLLRKLKGGDRFEDLYEEEYRYGYEDGYIKAKRESLAILGYLTISCLSLFIISWKI